MSTAEAPPQLLSERDKLKLRREARQRRILASGSDRLSRIKQAMHSDNAVLDPQGPVRSSRSSRATSRVASRAASPTPSVGSSRRSSVSVPVPVPADSSAAPIESSSVPTKSTPLPVDPIHPQTDPGQASTHRDPSPTPSLRASTSRRPSLPPPPHLPTHSQSTPNMDDIDRVLWELAQPPGAILSSATRDRSLSMVSDDGLGLGLAPPPVIDPSQVLPPGLLALFNASAPGGSGSGAFFGPSLPKAEVSKWRFWAMVHASVLALLLLWLARRISIISSALPTESSPGEPPYIPIFWYFVLIEASLQGLRHAIDPSPSSASSSSSSHGKQPHAAEALIAWSTQHGVALRTTISDASLLVFFVGMYSAVFYS